MTAEGPQAGLTHSRSLIVDPSVIVPALPPLLALLTDMPPVLATACMAAFVEATCIDALKPFLEEGQKTVGAHVDLSHVVATPMGMRVTAQVELAVVEGRKLRFKLKCQDEKEIIGTGFDERAVIDPARFLAPLEKKAAG